MKKIGDFICKKKNIILIITLILLIPAFIGMKLTKINYDILVYLPEDIETIKGQNILSEDFNMGAFSITVLDNMSSKDILKLESQIKNIDGVVKVISAYDLIGNTIPLDILPSNIIDKVKNGNSDLMLITYADSTSSEITLEAVSKVKEITRDKCRIGGMSALVLDTMDLSETEIIIYIIIAVLLCILILELSLDSYIVPFLLIINIGISILFNLGTNIFLGEISYITKALVAVLQLGVTTDFSIFLYHSYEHNKIKYESKEKAMSSAIYETFVSVVGSSLTTIAGFLVLCAMKLTLGKDLGLVMAKGVFLGVICVLTIFPSLLLFFDKYIEKTKHKKILPKFKGINNFVIKHHSNDVISIFKSDKYQMLLLNSTYDIATNELNNQVNIINNIIKKYDSKAVLAGEGPLMKDLVTISDNDFNNVNIFSIICILIIMLFVLKSYTLPILLIFVIEFAIFINMSVPYFSGDILPFVASIVLGTIQLGATIDYAILMTTTYLNNRKQKIEKNEAMQKTMESTTNSIIVSALCFFGATYGVGVYSKLEMISSLCMLISRGAIISMIVVIMVLPSVLLVFDKLICKTTIGVDRKMKIMNKGPKKLGTYIMLILACIGITPVYAVSKDETVYTKLDSDGNIKNILVNEHLNNYMKADNLEDITDLKEILNINGNEKFIQNNNKLIWEANGKDIFYQGVYDKKLPIDVEIKYYLDGSIVNASDIIGKSGRVTIKLKYNNNEGNYAIVNGKNELLYTPFVVTMGMIIDSENNSNINIIGGKTINNGNKNIIVGIATPGLYESLGLESLKKMNEITISFDTTKFELSSIYSVVTPKIINSDDLKIFDKLDLLLCNTGLLKNSIDKIEEGSKSIVEGANQINDGTTLVYQNLNSLVDNLEKLEEGLDKTDQGLTQIINNLKEMNDLLSNENMKADLDKINYLVNQNNLTIQTLINTNQSLKDTYDLYNLSSFTSKEILSFTSDIYANFGLLLSEEEVLNMNIKLFTVKNSYETSYEANENLIMLLTGNNEAQNKTLSVLNNTKSQIEILIKYLEEVENGLSSSFDGANNLRVGTSILADKTGNLLLGTDNLYDGSNKLYEGINTFNVDGITKLDNYINYNIKSTEEKIKALVKLGEDYSYTLKDNDTQMTTKFILVTSSEKLEDVQNKNVEVNKKTSFWDKLKDLFR